MLDKKKNFELIINHLKSVINKNNEKEYILYVVCKTLVDTIDYYDWVGFYLVDSDDDKMLVLGPYIGDPTDHTRIPFGKGVCGQAAEKKETIVIQDVSSENNYLSCSPVVKSEIVVPILKDGRVVGELDIDSHQKSPFTDEDSIFLNKICDFIAEQAF